MTEKTWIPSKTELDSAIFADIPHGVEKQVDVDIA